MALLAQDSYAVLEKSYAQAEDNFNIVKAKFEQVRATAIEDVDAQ